MLERTEKLTEFNQHTLEADPEALNILTKAEIYCKKSLQKRLSELYCLRAPIIELREISVLEELLASIRSPSLRRKGEIMQRNQTVSYFTIKPCSLGFILIAKNEKGICAIILGDEPDTLECNLQRLSRRATFERDDKQLQQVVRPVLDLVKTPSATFNLPIDLEGTPFQQQVWAALRKIPGGTTASYTDIARQIGSPRAVRAVAQACGANPVAIVVPCHRVIRQDGSLSGYRWGVERKKILLQREIKK